MRNDLTIAAAAAPLMPFNFNSDPRFQFKLDFSLQGIVNVISVMLILGHEPGTSRLENVCNNIFKDPAAKRDRTSDLVCSRCGQRFEAKAKSDDRFFYVGPDLLKKYTAEDAIIVFSFPNKILAVKAKQLYARRHLARLGWNCDREPFLDFYGLKIPTILEIRRRQRCRSPQKLRRS